MKRTLAILFCFLIPALLLEASSRTPRIQTGAVIYSTEEDFKTDVEAVPCKDKARLGAVKALFEKMGAGAAEILVEKTKDAENLVVTRQGASDDKIVIGAHYDKTPDGCGAIDNWSGIVIVTHLYRTLKQMRLNKTFIFVAFGKEEHGLVGSRAMVSAIPKAELPHYCAMINLDSFGLGAAQVARNLSSRKLEDTASRLAKEKLMTFGNSPIPGDSDSSSFLARKIPALTLHGLAGKWGSIIHSGNDQASRILPGGLAAGYWLALALALDIDKNPCDAFR
jgi:Zn-dependent M28 family amino/carboxypeptidase